VNLTDFTRVDSLALDEAQGEKDLSTAVSSGDYAYFG
jgi:hypothetical protein